MYIKEWHWEITRKCNLRCKHCISNCGLSNISELQTEQMIMAVNCMKRTGCEKVMITGGEPLCCDGFWEVLDECNKQDIAVHFLTNATLMDKDAVRRVIGHVEGVGISLDGANRKTNDFVRGKGVFEMVIRTIRKLAADIPVSVFVTASRFNLQEIKSAIELCRSLRVRHIHVSEINMQGRALSNRELFALLPSEKDRLRMMASEMTGATPIQKCEIDPTVVYMSSDGLMYSCVEIALHSPSNTNDKIRRNKPNSCPYQVFAGDDLVFCLNDAGSKCNLLEA